MTIILGCWLTAFETAPAHSHYSCTATKNEKNACTYLEQKIDHLSAVFTKSIDEVKRDVDLLKERESRHFSRENEIIAALRQENQELKAENSSLRDKVTNLSLITSDLNNKVKENENERLCLVTAIKLIQTGLRPREFQHDWKQQTKSVAEPRAIGQAHCDTVYVRK